MTLSLSLLATTAVSAFALGIGIGAWVSRLSAVEDATEIGNPRDLDPSEFSAFWQVRP